MLLGTVFVALMPPQLFPFRNTKNRPEKVEGTLLGCKVAKSMVTVKAIIVEYWFRTLCGLSVSIMDITKIIEVFGAEYESMDVEISHKAFTFQQDENIFILPFTIMDQQHYMEP